MFRFSAERRGRAQRTTHNALFVFIVCIRICSSIVTYKDQVLIQYAWGPNNTPILASSALNFDFGFWVSRFLVRDDEKTVDHA